MKYVDLTFNGGRKIAGPLFFIQGEEDSISPLVTTTSAVEKIVRAYPGSQLNYVTLSGIPHT